MTKQKPTVKVAQEFWISKIDLGVMTQKPKYISLDKWFHVREVLPEEPDVASECELEAAIKEADAILTAYPPEHEDFEDWNCCGGNDDHPPIHNMDCPLRLVLCIKSLRSALTAGARHAAPQESVPKAFDESVETMAKNLFAWTGGMEVSEFKDVTGATLDVCWSEQPKWKRDDYYFAALKVRDLAVKLTAEGETARVWKIHDEFLQGPYTALQKECHGLRDAVNELEAKLAKFTVNEHFEPFWVTQELTRVGLPNWRDSEGNASVHASQAMSYILKQENQIAELEAKLADLGRRK